MLRKRAIALAISLMFPAVAPALGLGTLKTGSALNQPFEGRIEILGAQPTDFDTLTIKLADSKQFERAGVLRSAVLLSLHFEVVTNDKGNDYIRVYTKDAVREPYLDFLLELNWADGKMLREYTVLLDPPLYDPNRRAAPSAATPPKPKPVAAPVAAPRSATPTAARPPAAPVTPPAGSLGAVQSGDTLWKLAQRAKPAEVTVQQMMIALLRANPAAFPTGNINVLKRGASLNMPTAAEFAALSRQEANTELARQNQLWQDYRQGSATRPIAQQARTAVEAPAAAPASEQRDAKLEIVNPAPQTATTAAPATSPTEGALGQEKAATESAETRELKARLDEAEDIIDLLQRQVQMKDDELARLQAAQAGKPMPSSGTSPTTAAEETPPVTAPAAETGSPAAAAETPAAAPAASTPPVAVTPPPPKPPVPAPVIPAPAPEGPLDALVPAPLRDAVPGGAITVLGVLASLLALGGLALARMFSRKASKAEAATGVPAIVTGAVAVASDEAAAPASDEAAKPAAKTVVPDLRDLSDTHPRSEAFDRFDRTIEASAESLVTDPLEEVNVYLAYERFDQAEELVRKVIAESPLDPRFRLRLLEIFYSSGNLPAYEAAAHEFLSLVGESDPMWQSALAMWNAMSPKRPLFSGAAPAAVASAAAVVDISSGATADAIENTQVGLFADAAGAEGAPLDETSDPTMRGMIDLTSGEDANDQDHVLDLTATVEKLTLAGFISAEAAAAPADHEMVDLTGGPSGGEGDLSRLLDLNSTGDVFDPGTANASNTLAEGLANTASGGGLASAFAPEPEKEVDFDIGDLSDLNLDVTSGPLDLGPAPTAGDDLDFDIGALSGGADLVDATSELKDLLPAADSGTSELIAQDFSLDLDLLGAEEPATALAADAFDDGQSMTLERPASDVDFDLSLDETGEVEVSREPQTEDLTEGALDQTALENLSAELEASLAALEDMAELPDGSELGLDLSSPDFGQVSPEDLEIDFDLADVDTTSLDLDITMDGGHMAEATGHDVSGQSSFDEVDSKLDLAKAYIELGEHQAARGILEEAAKEGSIAQQEEAGRLLAQIG